jgi:phage recombination protein Bet
MADRDLARTEVHPTDARAGAHPMDFTEEQRQLIRDTFANGASDAEFAVLMEIARARKLNPLLRQIHFVNRWDSEKHRPVWAAQVSIDGLRALAERTGLYQGQDEPEFVENPDGTLKLCKVRVWRRDWPRPAVGIAYWNEYVQTTRDKQTGKSRPTAMWSRMPHTMLAKCAEALAMRKAFPEDMSGLYTPEEMSQSQSDSSARAQVESRPNARNEIPVRAVLVAPNSPALPPVASAPPPASPSPAAPSPVRPSAPTLAAPRVERITTSAAAPAVKTDPWMDFYG